jgi:ATP-dependent Clp protease, protease subunit
MTGTSMSKQHHSFYEILNKSTEAGSVDILIYGAIPEMDWDTYTMKNTAEKFVKDFKALEKEYDRINIHINSPGGSLYHAFPIYNAIASSSKEIHTYNDGLAASAGGVLLIAGKTIHTAKNSFLMIHRAAGALMGNAEQLRDYADILEKYEKLIAGRFADKSGMTEEAFTSKFFNGKDHFLTADEAKEYGFVDIIEDYESENAPPSNITNMAFGEVLNLYKPKDEPGLFDRIVNHVRKTLNISTPAETTPPANPTPPTLLTDMNFENSIQLLEKETLNTEDIAAIKAEIAAYRSAGEKFTPEEVQAKIDEAVQIVQNEVTLLASAKADADTVVANLTSEKVALAAEKSSLATENSSLKVTIEAYRKSGVKIDNQGSETPDPILGEEGPENFMSETDMEVKKLREQAGLVKK